MAFFCSSERHNHAGFRPGKTVLFDERAFWNSETQTMAEDAGLF
jgi:hypothetical protein